MENNFVATVIKTTISLTIIASLSIGIYAGFSDGLAVFFGASWGMANLYFIKISLEKWLVPENRDHLMLFAFLQLKFPLLYLAGYGLLKLFSPLYLVVGSSLIFLALFILGIYRAMNQTKGLV